MTNPALRTVLDAIGIDWYVRSDQGVLDVGDTLAEADESSNQNIPKGDSVVPTNASATNLSVEESTKKLVEDASVANLLSDIRLDAKPQPKTKPEPDTSIETPVTPAITDNSSTVQAPAVFNWLVAECGRLLFVADIKQPKLSAVWHSAALEMMNDIAIAMDQTQNLSSRYFNWPILTPNGQPLADVDLDGFLTAFLEHRAEKPVILLMGDTAYSLGKAFVADNAQIVESPSLGDLFTKPESKRLLWQLLKPLK